MDLAIFIYSMTILRKYLASLKTFGFVFEGGAIL